MNVGGYQGKVGYSQPQMNVGGYQGNVGYSQPQPQMNMNVGGYQGNVGYPQPQKINMNVGYPNVNYSPHVNVGLNPNMQYSTGQGGVVVINQGLGNNNRPYVCGRVVPRIDACGAVAVLVLNIFFPGFGTMICGCVPHEGSMNCCGDCCCFFWLGYAHCLLTPILVGWILGIVLGCQLIAVAALPYEAPPTTYIVKS